MNDTTKVRRLEARIERLQHQIERLTEDNTVLKRENESLLERVELANSLITDCEENIKEAKALQEELTSTLLSVREMKERYSKEFKAQLNRITKQK